MKKIFYFIFCLNFFLCKIAGVKKNKVLMMKLHNEGESGALALMENALNEYGEYEIVHFDRKQAFSSVSGKIEFLFSLPKDMASSSYIFLNDNFMPMANMRFSEKTTVIQLWHGAGAMKRSCLAMKLPKREERRLIKCNKNIDALIVPSKSVIPVFKETFGIPEQKILPLGAPRNDLIIGAQNKAQLRDDFIKKYPQCENKKIVLYAPTFRDDEEQNYNLMSHFPFKEFSRLEDYALLVRLHPQVGGFLGNSSGYIDVTDYPSVTELVLIADVLISDYSSVIMDFAVQNKPMVFFAFDLDEFNKNGRGFYFDYEDYVPGPVVKSGKELIEVFSSGDFKEEKIPAFRDYNFDYLDKYNCIRIIEQLIK